MYNILILFLLFFCVGCSNKEIYDNIQINNRNECNKMPPSQYKSCIEQTSKPYREYEKEHKELIEK